MAERPRKKFHLVSDFGKEGRVLGYKRGKETGAWVIKKLDNKYQDGIPKETAMRLRERFQLLRQEFGELIPNQKIMPLKNTDRYFTAQERLTLAQPADVFEYTPETIPPAAQAQLKKLVATLRRGYEAYKRQEDEYGRGQHPALDLGPGNLLLTTENQVRFVDTNTLVTEYADLFINDALPYEIDCRLAQLELLAGREPRAVFNDEFYREVMEIAEFLNPQGLERSLDDAGALKTLLDDIFMKSPLRAYLDPDRA